MSEGDKIWDAADTFLRTAGLDPTPDAIGQLVEFCLPSIAIMCDENHPWDPNGATWRQAGRLGALADVRKKFMRLWERAWKHGKRHDDSGHDMHNYLGFYMRADAEGFGDWGEPKLPDPVDDDDIVLTEIPSGNRITIGEVRKPPSS